MWRLNQLSKTSPANSSTEDSTKLKTQDWTFTRATSGNRKALHSLTWGYVTLMPSLNGDREIQQIYSIHENDKKRLYSRRVLDIEHGSFTPLVFTTTGGMGKECQRYHCRLAELIAAKKGEQYAQTISWIRAKTSFALLRSALVCLRRTRVERRAPFDFNNHDIDVAVAEGAILF